MIEKGRHEISAVPESRDKGGEQVNGGGGKSPSSVGRGVGLPEPLNILGRVLLALLLGAGLYWWVAGEKDPSKIERPHGYYGRSSLHTGAYGGKAFYLLLQDLGIPTARRSEPLELFTPRGRPLLVLAAPHLLILPSEQRWLRSFAAQGGNILLIPYASSLGRYHSFPVGSELLARFNLELAVLPGEEKEPIDLTAEAGSVAVPIEGMSIDGHRRPALSIREKGRLFWSGDPPEGSRVLAQDDTGLVVVAVPWMRGTVIAMSDPFPLTNRGLTELDNATFLVSLAREYAGPAGVLFDEYHHGLRSEPSVARLLADTGLGLVVLQILVILVVWLYRGAVRFGHPVEESARTRRRGIEQVGALANLYERTGASSLVAMTLWRRFSERVRKQLMIFPVEGQDENVQLARSIGARVGLKADVIYHLYELSRRSSLDASELVQLDRQLNDIQRRIRDVTGSGQSFG